MKIYLLTFILFFIFSCQTIEKNNQVVFDNKQLSKFDIFSDEIEIQIIFEKKISEPYIGHTLKTDPTQRIINWIEDNFNNTGNENRFLVSILDASLIETQFENIEAKKLDDKINNKYEIFFLVEFNLIDDSNNLIASTLVEVKRSTTSGNYISIQEKENIINNLIYSGMIDLSTETKRLLFKYMKKYIL